MSVRVVGATKNNIYIKAAVGFSRKLTLHLQLYFNFFFFHFSLLGTVLAYVVGLLVLGQKFSRFGQRSRNI